MMHPIHRLCGAFAAIPWILVGTITADAFEDRTHEAINLHAAQLARIHQMPLDAFLKRETGLVQGLQTRFRDDRGATNDGPQINTGLDWLRLGGMSEDRPLCRTARHFHDPLQPWSSAGLIPSDPVSSNFIALLCRGSSFPSSVLWAQDRQQDVGGQRSWFDARASYLDALIKDTQTARDTAWAHTLRTLGQLMHLVADASVPEHVRNDVHIMSMLSYIGIPVGTYERWVEARLGDIPFSGPPPFDRAILQQPTDNSQAPIPIARLFDTDTYTGLGSGPGVTLGPAIGIAEFANANFFSEDTGHRSQPGSYPFPAIDLLVESQHPAPLTTNTRRYYKKGDGGLPVDPVLAECVFDMAAKAAGLPAPASYNCVDENVWQATASQMVPRAVDYAAGVLEYFFRGQIEIAPPARFVYGLATFEPGNTGAFTRLRFKVRNATPGEDAGAGQMTAVVRYRKPTGNANLIDNPGATISQQLYFAVSEPIAPVTLTSTFQEFDFNFRVPVPTNSADLFLTVVYRGPLGLEQDAVMVGGKDLFEPDPLDVGNASDWECAQGELYYVANAAKFPPYQPPSHTERDVDKNGSPDLLGPWVTQSSFAKTFDLSEPPALPSESNFDLAIGQAVAPEYGRVMLLQDQPWYGVSALTYYLAQTGGGPVVANTSMTGTLYAVYNNVVVTPSGELGRLILPSGVYRSVPIHHAFLFVSGNTLPCMSQTRSLSPGLIRIPTAPPID